MMAARIIFYATLLCIPFIVGGGQGAWAACTTPDGVAVEGEIVYNQQWKVVQFCNGDKWVAMTGGGGGGGGVAPSGAVLAFDLDDCPTGWTAYAPSSGRFLRGRCIAGETCNDPDGTRVVGGVQGDDLKSHGHSVSSRYGAAPWNGGGVASTDAGGSLIGSPTSNTGGAETRPKNVALLYCRKD